jgi:hypothetical protein
MGSLAVLLGPHWSFCPLTTLQSPPAGTTNLSVHDSRRASYCSVEQSGSCPKKISLPLCVWLLMPVVTKALLVV